MSSDLTQEEWDERWLFVYNQAWQQTKHHQESFTFAHAHMKAKYGPRPDGEPGPPWWLNFAALSLGVSMQKIWDFLNGKKTIIGAVITGLAVVSGWLPDLLPFVGVDAVLTAKIVGISVTVLGLVHKAYKFIYKEEHP